MSLKPWLAHYDPGVPETLEPYPERTLLDYVREAAERRPDATAVIYYDRVLTWQELEQTSNAVATALMARGIRKGDRVGLLLPNTPQMVISQLAVWKLGAIVVGLNPLYSTEELVRAVKLTGTSLVITLTRFYGKVKQVQHRAPLKGVVVTGIHEYFTKTMRALYGMALARREGDVVEVEPGDLRFADLREVTPQPLGPAPRSSDLAFLLLSGGTTGLPKAVEATHRALLTCGLQIRVWVAGVLREWDDSVLLPLPIYHVFGMGVQSIALVGRNPLVLVPNPRDIDGLVKAMQHTRPAFVALVPALMSALLSQRDVRHGRVDLRFIKGVFSGSAPLLAETRRRFEELTGSRILEGYSLTEALMACVVNPVLGENKPGCAGMPLPDVELMIVDDSGTKILPQGEVGEVVMRAPQIMPGYWKDVPETARTLRKIGEGKPWLFTGDVGYLDEDGYLFLVDRKKDLVKVGGLQVWPREVEEAIAKHAAVAEVGVTGVADPHKGEVVKAWVVLRDGGTLTESQLRAHCHELLAAYKVPAHFEFTDALPRNSLGKVLRRELNTMSAATAGTAHH